MYRESEKVKQKRSIAKKRENLLFRESEKSSIAKKRLEFEFRENERANQRIYWQEKMRLHWKKTVSQEIHKDVMKKTRVSLCNTQNKRIGITPYNRKV